ncbi:hypothetical protein [Microvirga sp. Mcv34]|uniref:hypothetical protein n=1 Tax=Microvirga sp. Mcv34 TaxID=2926016 RepID=UPI0021C718D8|nr:hypothetical protein [Microvirga sp. Mcv34]
MRAIADLHLGPNDETTIFLAAVGAFEGLSRDIQGSVRGFHEAVKDLPDRVEAAAARAVGPVADAATARVEQTYADLSRKAGEAVATSAAEHFKAMAASRRIQVAGNLIVAGILVSLVLLAGAFGGGWLLGKSSPYAGSGSATEETLKRWALTRDGRAAYDLSKLTSLVVLAECSGTGWEKQDRYDWASRSGAGYGRGFTWCYPFPSSVDGRTYGWQIGELPFRQAPPGEASTVQ